MPPSPRGSFSGPPKLTENHHLSSSVLWCFSLVNNRGKTGNFFSAACEKPHGLRVFAKGMHENRELTGNLVASR